MIYDIQIGEKSFRVSIDDINKRPIIAHIDGREYQVTPETNVVENGNSSEPEKKTLSFVNNPTLADGIISAPLPGTVIDIFIKAGDIVETGQVIMIIEAMKMKNSIRSTKDGTVASVLVATGQNVSHKQTLVEFIK